MKEEERNGSKRTSKGWDSGREGGGGKLERNKNSFKSQREREKKGARKKWKRHCKKRLNVDVPFGTTLGLQVFCVNLCVWTFV